MNVLGNWTLDSFIEAHGEGYAALIGQPLDVAKSKLRWFAASMFRNVEIGAKQHFPRLDGTLVITRTGADSCSIELEQ
jgi:hypothetical protein